MSAQDFFLSEHSVHLIRGRGRSALHPPGMFRVGLMAVTDGSKLSIEKLDLDHVQMYITHRKSSFAGFGPRVIDEYNETSEDDMTIEEVSSL